MIFILPICKIYFFSGIGAIYFSLYIFSLYFLVSKYNFMNLSYSILAEEILSNINEMVLILDNDFKIVNANKNFNKLLEYNPEKLKNKDFFELITDKENLKEKIVKMFDPNLNIRINYVKNNDFFITNSYISKIRDKYNDLTGYLIISSEIKEIKQFQKYFKITNRELEIIQNIISGHTYKEILG